MNTVFLPKQKVSEAEKRKDGFAWAKATMRAILDFSEFGTTKGVTYEKLYKAYAGEIDKVDYSYVTDPYKSKDGKVRRMPARIRNYNIIKPVVDLLVGEKSRRPSSYTVVNVSPDAVNKFQEDKRQLTLQYLKQLFVNIANQEGTETGQEPYDTSVLEKQLRTFSTTYKDAIAEMGQEALEYLRFNLKLDDHLLTEIFDYIVTGTAISYKGLSSNDVDYEPVSPIDIDYDKSQGVKYIQDSSWVARRQRLTINDIVDKFYDELTSEDIDELESEHMSFGSDWLSGLLSEDYDTPKRSLPVYHVTWKAFAKIGFVTKPNELGELETIEVNDQYEPLPGEEVEWYWVNEAWEGYRLGNDKYIGIGKIPGQRSSIDNPSKCKLPYNGVIYADRFADPISVVSIGLPYQILYNIFHYRLELSIAKNKDKIMLMEMNTIPKRHGWDEEKFMYHADANGFAFVDSTSTSRTGKDVNFNQWTVLDMSLGQYISSQFELLEAIKMEWEQLMGITPQRLGNIQASAGKSTTERAVFQSSVISEELFRKFEGFEQTEMQGLLDLSQIAWVDGKKGMYINSDGKNAVLNIDPETFPHAELGIFAWYSAEEKDKLEALRQLSLEFTQNGSKPSTIAEILDAKNFAKIKSILKEVEKRQEEFEQAQAQAQQEGAERLERIRIEDREDQQAFQAELKEKELQNKIDLKLLDKDSGDESIKSEELKEKERSNRAKEDIEREKLKIEREVLKVQERIAKMNANKSKVK
jgi:hypothetical protein